MSKPKIVRCGRRLHISRDVGERLNVTKCYPIKASNGSLITVSGSRRGLYIAWTGGRQLFFTSKNDPPERHDASKRTSSDDFIEDADSDDEALFESEDESTIDAQFQRPPVQELELDLGSAVLHLAVPQIPTLPGLDGSQAPNLFTKSIVVAVSCEDGSSRIINLPLDPPSAATKRKRKLGARICKLEHDDTAGLPSGLDISWGPSVDQHGCTGSAQQRQSKKRVETSTQPSGTDLLVVTTTQGVSPKLSLFAIPISCKGDSQTVAHGSAMPFYTSYLDDIATSVQFNPAASPIDRHSQLLISDIAGGISIYDTRTKGSLNSASGDEITTPHLIHRFGSSFLSPAELACPALSYRKRVLASAWVLSGLSVLVLLEDGTLGLYAFASPAPAAKQASHLPSSELAAFSRIGSEAEQPSTFEKSTKSSRLAPMTPNTRRQKSDNLFSGSMDTMRPRGGIATRPTGLIGGPADDAAVVYYKSSVISIPSVREWWARNTTGAERGGPGLYGSGLIVEEVDMGRELITSVDILPSTGHKQSSDRQQVLGSKRMPWDILVVGEYRTHFLTSTKQRPVTRDRAPDSPSYTDKRLLQMGELGVDGLDRMLDGMEGVERRVGFLD